MPDASQRVTAALIANHYRLSVNGVSCRTACPICTKQAHDAKYGKKPGRYVADISTYSR